MVTAVKTRFRELKLATISPDPDQPRKAFSEQGNLDLSRSMAAEGLLQPITVRLAPAYSDRFPAYILIAGERRLRAAALLGWWTIPAIIKDGIGEVQATKLQLLENIVRKDLNPVEEAMAFQKMLSDGYTLGELSSAVGLAGTQISWRVKMLDARDDVLDLVARGHLTPSCALAMSKLSHSGQGRVLRVIGNGDVKTRDVEVMCSRVSSEENQSEMFTGTKVTQEQVRAVRTFSDAFDKIGVVLTKIAKMEEDNPQALAEAFVAEGGVMSLKIGEAVKGLNRVRSMLDRQRVESMLDGME